MRKILLQMIFSALLLLGVLRLQVPLASAHSLVPNTSCTYGPLDYKSASSTSTPNGTLSGNSATEWGTNAGCFSCAVGANSNGASGGFSIWATAAGSDRCRATDAWTNRMYTDHTNTSNSTYTNAGLTYGAYFDCSQGDAHAYLVRQWHDWYSDPSTAYETNSSWIY